MANVMIFTSRTCGWAVRNYAALIEKGIRFETTPAADSKGNKLDEFLALTPYGRTPVLVSGDTVVFESTLINDYIDDRFPDPPLMPGDVEDRSVVRQWIHYCEDLLLPSLTAIAREVDGESRELAADRFNDHLLWFGTNVLPDTWRGPYLLGDQFSLADLCFYTLFRTRDEMERHLETKLPIRHPAIRKWAGNILARPSIRRAQEIQRGLEF